MEWWNGGFKRHKCKTGECGFPIFLFFNPVFPPFGGQAARIEDAQSSIGFILRLLKILCRAPEIFQEG